MPAKGKKFSKTYTDSKTGRKRTVSYGAKGYSISPGTSKGDNYCARSYGINKQAGYDCSGKDKNKPNCLSRAKWKCKGKKSMRESLQSPPFSFSSTRTTIIKCTNGWIFVRPTARGEVYLISATGHRQHSIRHGEIGYYIDELCSQLGGYVRHFMESVSPEKVVSALLDS